MGAKKDTPDDVARELDEIRKDPERWKEFMATQAEKALDNWRGRKKR